MVRRLRPTTDTRDLAVRLNAAGLATGHGKPFDIAAVQWIRHAYKIPAPDPYNPGELSVAQAASRLGCSTGVVYYWLKTGQITARRGAGNRLCIPWTSQIETDCRARIAQSGHLTPAAHRTSPRQDAEAAENVNATQHAVFNGSPNGLTTQISIHPEHSHTRLQEGQYEWHFWPT